MESRVKILLASLTLTCTLAGCAMIDKSYRSSDWWPKLREKSRDIDKQSIALLDRAVSSLSRDASRPLRVDDSTRLSRLLESLAKTKQRLARKTQLTKELRDVLSSVPDQRVRTHISEADVKNAEECLPEIAEKLRQVESHIQRIKDRYIEDRRRYESGRRKYVEHLCKGFSDKGIRDALIFIDENVVICVQAAVRTADRVAIVVNAYLIAPKTSQLTFGSPESVCNRVFLYDDRGRSLGTCTAIEERRPRLTPDLVTKTTVALVWESEAQSLEGPFKLFLERWAIRNNKAAEIQIPRDFVTTSTEALSTSALATIVHVLHELLPEIQKIECTRVGNHLTIPTTIDIHGREIRADMMLDTGASLSLVPIKLYSRGNAEPLADLRSIKLQAVGGLVDHYLDDLLLSTSAYSKTLPVAISPSNMALLGADYFEGIVFTVDVENECVYVHPKSK